jgi:acetoin utilization protein AcuC
VLTISLHQHGRSLFPGTGYVFDTGRGRGRGYSVNVPLLPGSDDQVFIRAFEDLVPDLIAAYRPDVLVTQLGADMLRTDPLTDLCLTTNGFAAAVRSMKNMNLPWLALGGGGYHIVNVARAWTLAWAVMNDVEPPDDLPEPFLRQIRPLGYREQKLRDEPLVLCDGDGEPMTAARQAVDTIRRTALASIDRASHRAQGVVGD